MLTDERLAEIRAVTAAASACWALTEYVSGHVAVEVRVGDDWCVPFGLTLGREQRRANQEFVSQAAVFVVELLAEVERLRAEVDLRPVKDVP